MNDPFSQKIPPQNIDAEQSVICALLIDNDIILDVLEILSINDFYNTAHQQIYSVIAEMFSENVPVDLVTLTNSLKERGKLEAIGGATYLAGLVNNVPIAVNAVHYAEIICGKALLRRIIKVVYEILTMCFNDS